MPVLNEMPAGPLRTSLSSAFTEEREALRTIEESFVLLTSKPHDPEHLKRFFQSWSQTNNSAASVSGLACRITLKARELPGDAEQLAHYRVVDSLQRITDEDFGARGEILHADLYHRMATAVCGDDSWQLLRYRSAAAREFRARLGKQRLRERNLLTGLLHTLIHEVYTHGEVELIHPMFQEWLPAHLEFPAGEARKVLAWITVHTGGTETNHFRHATDAVERYCAVSGTAPDTEAATELFRAYLRAKAAVMEDLVPVLR
ncbi:hypothetical protein [Streptomyces sp. NPDC053079]|uniref:hypothetical protein n=2 Tax=unclassified Streptomyces TaxID=2593676 RepID=UPI0037CF4117